MKLDRLLGILTVLLRSESVTCPELAARFEVTRRTIGRDIDALCKAGIPVVTRQGAGGGISIAEGFRLDKSVLTADELSGIIAALKGLGSVSDKSNIERTLDKLGAGSDAVLSLSEPIVIDLASYYKGSLTEKIGLIKRAIRERRLIAFDYYYEKGEDHREIEPSTVVFQGEAWYVFSFCLKRRDWRMFKLMRLWGLTLSDVGFTPRELPPGRMGFGTDFPDDKRLVALFDKSERYRLIETYGLSCYTETEEGLLFQIGFSNRNFVARWLLGFGGRVKVLEPDYLAEDMKAEAEKILSRYE
jgi:predicted DNA-binding transcriptional regulator YafY